MDIVIHPTRLHGTLTAIPSKSQAHRLLICAAFSDRATTLSCPETNRDIEATADCLRSLGAKIVRTQTGYTISPVCTIPKQAVLPCGESGSTLRFLLPVVGALGVEGTFQLEGRLPYRPLSPLWEEMERMGCVLTRPSENTVRCTGKLNSGAYSIDGSISSQYISGLLFALALIDGHSTLTVTGKMESIPYIEMTRQALQAFGVATEYRDLQGSYPLHSPGQVSVEGDWSNGAFFVAASVLGSNVEILGLQLSSPQGDKAVVEALSALERPALISAADIPDLVPILAIVAGAKHGCTFTDTRRLRLKESDRVETIAAMLRSLGADVIISENSMVVKPGNYRACTIDAAGDHRIAMAAAIAATVADGPVTICGAECVAKSYPTFWEEYKKLGGQYEQYIR